MPGVAHPSIADIVVSFFQVISILGCVLTGLKLYRARLHRSYRIFFAYLVFAVPYMIFMLLAGTSSDLYFLVFFWTEPVIMLFYILMVLELYHLVLARYRGLYTLGRWAMWGALVVSASISVLSLVHRLSPTTPQNSVRLFIELAVERGVDFALVIFILLIVLFLSRYPIPLSRNVVVHTGVYTVYFLSNTMGLLLRSLFGFKVVTGAVNLGLIGISAACTVAWWLGLSAKGEEVQAHVPTLSFGSEQRILQQLDALNATLLKVSRK